ncbi:MAG: phosphohydrolase [Patescibacteria group bacterium]
MLTREKVLKFVNQSITNRNLVRHLLAVEAAMKALARRFSGDEAEWGLLGLIHDADWELTEPTPSTHTRLTLEWLSGQGVSEGPFVDAIKAHNRRLTNLGEPNSTMAWALDCVDELTGFIVAVALVRPDKKLATVALDSIKKKWKTKEFARAVDRAEIEKCQEKLGLGLDEFIETTLKAMQSIAGELGL